MLTTLNNVLAIPGMGNLNTLYPNFLPALINASDRAIKSWLKRDIEQTDYVEYYSGDGQNNLVLKQYPVSKVTNVWLDFNGAFGQGPNAFSASPLVLGTYYALRLDSGGLVSNRGLLQRLGGYSYGASNPNAGGWGPSSWDIGAGKLAASRLPGWPIGYGNLKVSYTAGYPSIPSDLVYASNMLIAWMARNMPTGDHLNNESFESYSYSIAQTAVTGGLPELGQYGQILLQYREVSL